MNGLKYHYVKTPLHGTYGLRMILNGTHPIARRAAPPVQKDTYQPSAPASVKKVPDPLSNPAVVQRPFNSTTQSRVKRRPKLAASSKISRRRGTDAGPVTLATVKTGSRPPPVQTTRRDALLYTSYGNDPLDVMGRMDYLRMMLNGTHRIARRAAPPVQKDTYQPSAPASVKKIPAPPSAPAVMQRPINSGVDVLHTSYWNRPSERDGADELVGSHCLAVIRSAARAL
ncbi:MAG: hypothetical protein TREMPRED_004524 [Tremellales sp. Tagirdzhanova-0007]|nr:MAG: hypothetical protein TREMPRED_004524 [Tremellales sp. Tagirdzhanova-0007]